MSKELNWNDKLIKIATARRQSSSVLKRTLVEFFPKTWPKAFYINPRGIKGTTCADLKEKPCDGCDGWKCVKEFIDLRR